MKKSKKIYSVLILAVLFSMLFLQCFEAGAIVNEDDVILKIVCKYNDIEIPNASFNIYYIADMDSNCHFEPEGAFKNYPVDINAYKGDSQALAQTLYGYVMLDGIQPTDTGKTNLQGELVFSTSVSNLKQGMYLIASDGVVLDNYRYTFEPFLISLPLFNYETKSFEYNVTAYPKVERKAFDTDSEIIETDSDSDSATESDSDTSTDTDSNSSSDNDSDSDTDYGSDTDSDSDTNSDNTTELSVFKKWNDKGYEESRPKSVTVNLLKNGAVYDTAELSADNNWYCTWSGLDSKSDWTVVEIPVSNYTVLVVREGSTFIVNNTATDLSSDSDSDSESSFPSTDSSSESTPLLPQTGTMWWGVPILFVIGLAIFFAGYIIRRGSDDEE